jgi:ParB/RepB/Spo0J family partition protein
MADLSTTPIEQVKIAAITIGSRRRRKLGPLASLAKSIKEQGLIHPIVLRDGNELVVGARRLAACTQLGWKTIPARRVETMSDDELRAIELDENVQRLDLNSYEASGQCLAKLAAEAAKIAEEEAAAMAKEERVSADSADTPMPERRRRAADTRVSKRGRRREGKRPKGKVSRKKLAERTGVSETTQREVEEHVRLAELYPVFRRPEWKKLNVLQAGELLDHMPSARDRIRATALIVRPDDRPPLDPARALCILKNLADFDDDWRREVLKMAESEDEETRDKALTTAARLPPQLDPRFLDLQEITTKLRRLWQRKRDDHAARILDVAERAEKIVVAMRGDYQRERERLMRR